MLDALDYYALLGVTREAPPDDIRRGFHEFARRYHPDHHVGAPAERLVRVGQVFRRGAEAYDVLKDDRRRAIYDQVLADGHKRLLPMLEAKANRARARAPKASAGSLADVLEPGKKAVARIRTERLSTRSTPDPNGATRSATPTPAPRSVLPRPTPPPADRRALSVPAPGGAVASSAKASVSLPRPRSTPSNPAPRPTPAPPSRATPPPEGSASRLTPPPGSRQSSGVPVLRGPNMKAKPFLERAKRAIAKGNLAEALSNAERALEFDPEHPMVSALVEKLRKRR